MELRIGSQMELWVLPGWHVVRFQNVHVVLLFWVK